MKKLMLGIAFAALAMLGTAPAAFAQHHGGGNYNHGGGNFNHGGGNFNHGYDGRGGYNGGYDHRGGYGGYDHRGGYGGYDHRGGYGGYDHRGGGGGVGIYIGPGGVGIGIGGGHRGPGWYGPGRGYGWDYGRYPVYRPYPYGWNGPVYNGRWGYRGPVIVIAPRYVSPSISAYVTEYEPVYDDDGYVIGEYPVGHYVTAYWDNARGGYWYTDCTGQYVRVR